MHASFAASDFRPTTPDAQWQWVDAPNGTTTARGITPVGRRETFYVRLDTPTGSVSPSATVYLRPADGGAILLWEAVVVSGGQLSRGLNVPINSTGRVVSVPMFGGGNPGVARYIFCDLDPGDVLVGMRLQYRPGPGEFVPVTPQRVFDSRTTGRIQANQELFVQVPAPVTTEGAHAAHLNVTVTGTTAAGFLAVYPGGFTWPGTSNVNWTAAGQVAAGGTTVGLGEGQTGEYGVSLRHGGPGQLDVIVDYTGYYRV